VRQSDGKTLDIGVVQPSASRVADAGSETSVVASNRRFGGSTAVVLGAPLTLAHPAGAQFSGSGITLSAALTRQDGIGAQVSDNVPTPGVPNKY